MCKASIVFIALALGSAGAAGGQDAMAWRDSTQRISAQIRALRDSLLEQDSTVTEVTRRGALVISATAANRSEAAAALEEFDRERTPWFGAALPSPQGFRIVLGIRQQGWVSRRFRFWGEPKPGTLVLTGLPDTGTAARIQRNMTSRNFGRELVFAFSELMFGTLGPSLQAWLRHTPPMHLSEQERRSLAMYAVVTGNGPAERGCVEGNLTHCLYALGLRLAPTPDLTDQYPALVRSDLLLTALKAGGPDAWSRLRSAGNVTVEDALAAAARMPADSLIRLWRGQMISLRPTAHPLANGRMLMTGVWTVLLLLGALGASRWR